jgi:hypothetical protein
VGVEWGLRLTLRLRKGGPRWVGAEWGLRLRLKDCIPLRGKLKRI